MCRTQATFSLRDFPKLQPAMACYATEIRNVKADVAFSTCLVQHNPAKDSDLGVQVRLLPFTETSEVAVGPF